VIKKPALGRGLSALLPGAPHESISTVKHLEINNLLPNPRQPRRSFDEEGLAELAASIKESGILQPVLVTRDGERFRILAGERRVRAARLAGLDRVPVLLRDNVGDRDQLLLALVENLQRRDLTPLEEANAYQQLREQFRMTQEEVAERVGKDRATVANAIRLLKLPAAVRTALEEGRLSAGHARALLPLSSAEDQERLARAAATKGHTVRWLEERVNELVGEKKKSAPRRERKSDADTRDAELRLSRALGTRVEIRRKRRGGELRVAFFTEDQLIGLFERLVRGGGEEP
jgi:ParB family chromosome partitioning protein